MMFIIFKFYQNQWSCFEEFNFKFWFAILDQGTGTTAGTTGTIEQEYSSSLGLSWNFSWNFSLVGKLGPSQAN